MKNRVFKIVFAAVLTAALIALTACAGSGNPAPTSGVTQAASEEVTQAPSQPPTDPPTEAPTESPTTAGPSAAYTAMKSLLESSKANGYTIGTVDGVDSRLLLLSVGMDEASRRYEFYAISDDGISYMGDMGASHSGLYVYNESGKLGLFWAQMGAYSYGPLNYTDGVFSLAIEEQSGTEPVAEYPPAPGTTVQLTDITDLSLIESYK